MAGLRLKDLQETRHAASLPGNGSLPAARARAVHSSIVSRLMVALGFVVAMIGAPDEGHAQGSVSTATGICGTLDSGFGPFDYRTAAQKDREIVERFHFTPSVEALRKGATGPIGGDLNYTLRAFPNHPRALYAMARYALQLGTMRIPGALYPAECYFDRAIRFTPDDAQVRALYADFLIRLKRPQEARQQLEFAETLAVSSPQTTYNLALAWAELGVYDKALPLARKAYAAGVQFPGLRNKLKTAGVWKE